MIERKVEYAEEIMKILEDTDERKLPLTTVKEKLHQRLRDLKREKRELAIDAALKHVLDTWLAIKIIDYDEDADLVWFLKALNESEAKRFGDLPEIDQTLLKMLYECDDERKLGAMRRDEAITRLNELGFKIDSTPIIPGIVSQIGILEEGGIRRWVYIIPQYEFSEEFKALEQESLEKARRIDERMMRED